MHAQIRLARIAGVDIGANWSWIVIVALIVWSLGATVFPTQNPGLADATYVAMAVAASLLFFVSLLAHELGHAVVARREGMEIDGIVLWMFGGVARFKGLFPSAGAELRIALAGPAVSLAIGVVMLAAGRLLSLPAEIDGVVTWLGTINVVLLVFNMLPALPLDGGRVLRALLWGATRDFVKATRIAAALGRGFGQLMIALGLALLLLGGAVGGLWLALIGLFLIAAAGAEGKLATTQEALSPLKVADAMAVHPVVAQADMTLSEFADRVFAHSRHAAYPVLDGSRVTGLLTFRDLAAFPPARWAETHVRELARDRDAVPVLGPDDDLGTAAVELMTSDVGRALVLDDDRLVGLLSMTDVSRLIELRRHDGGATSPAARSRARSQPPKAPRMAPSSGRSV